MGLGDLKVEVMDDGAEIVDDDYLSLLPDNTRLMVIPLPVDETDRQLRRPVEDSGWRCVPAPDLPECKVLAPDRKSFRVFNNEGQSVEVVFAENIATLIGEGTNIGFM